MKIVYVTPKIQVMDLPSYNLLTTSGVKKKVSEFLPCPCIPQTKCQLFCAAVRRGYEEQPDYDKILEALENGKSNIQCPYKSVCEEAKLYETFTENEKQR